MRNKIRGLLREKRQFFGATVMLGSARAAEVLAGTGFDFLMVDMQHGPFDKATATDAIRVLVGSGAVPFARVSENAAGEINDLLDAGALGVVVPMIESAADAADAVRRTFYPPVGKRSRGGSPTAVHGDEYAKWANAEILLTIIIETAEAVERAGEILAVPGLDLCLLGTSDLSLDMQCARDDSRIREAASKLIELGARHGVAIGVSIGGAADVAAWQDLRPDFYLVSHDHGMLKAAGRELADNMRKTMGV